MQEHHKAQSREHAQLLEAHTKLGIMPPPASASHPSELQQPPAEGNRILAPALVVPPQPPSDGLAAMHDSASLSTAAAAALSLHDLPAGARDSADMSMTTRNRLVQELQRFDLPQELRQMLMNMPSQPSRQQV